jgi:molecular chaperone GrpE
MSEDGRGAPAPEGAQEPIKVVDRRRFRPDGGPADEGGRSEEAEEVASAAEPDPRDATLATQATRIDELSRAYAALLEDNKGFRQRVERERVRVLEAERASLAQGLLDATDDLERALAAVSGAADTQSEAVRTLAEGVGLSLAGLEKRVAELGAQRIRIAGLPFDPHVAEAVDTIPVSDAEQDGLVLQEIRSGWRIGDRVLRPARVRVGRLARA